MKISVIGTGYVGLVSGVCLAEKGHRVVCVDSDLEKVQKINRGEAPIYEDGLGELLCRHIGKTLSATTDLQEAVLGSELSLIAVGTPYQGSKIDLRAIKLVCEQVGRALAEKQEYHVVVVKSTVVPGTTDTVVKPILEQASGKQAGPHFGVGMNPEFLREGNAVVDFLQPDRIVMGGMDARTVDALEELYAVFEGVPKIRTANKTAEMIKYTSNSLLATLISFSNEIGNLCAALGDIDTIEVMKGVHLDKRLTTVLEDGRRVVPQAASYLWPGCGFGGSCFPKDVKALIAHGKQAGRDMDLLETVIRINESQPRQVISILKKHYPSLAGLRVAVLGLAFKPGTDDMRESPAVPIIRQLVREGAQVKAYDPIARHEAEKLLGNHDIHYMEDVAQAVAGVQAIVLTTAWEEFRGLPAMLAGADPQPLLVDGRRFLDKTGVARYDGVGL